MARRLRLRIVPDANRDLISELPLELKVGILECLSIRDAARTTVLSTQWNDVWLRLGRLSFNIDLLLWHIQRCSDQIIVPHKIITYILLHRVEPVKKFRVYLSSSTDPTLKQQSYLDEWCLYLSTNGIEELDISYNTYIYRPYKLPFCIVSCPTIKQLRLRAQRRLRLKMVAEASRDLISELPFELKLGILECLPTRDAARTAVLSTHWNDVWSQLGRLSFDIDFFWYIQRYSGKSIVPHKIITDILLHRVEPVKKFRVYLSSSTDPTLKQQSYLDEWCLSLSTNGIEELDIDYNPHNNRPYKLSFCIVSCPTIKHLRLHAQRLRLKMAAEASRDLISELPLELKVGILECLPIRDPPELLCSQHTGMMFGCGLAGSLSILKFREHLNSSRDPKLKQQSYLDEWCLYLSTNGIEELDISYNPYNYRPYKLPFCIVSCPTIKHLRFRGFDFPINGSNQTLSLAFDLEWRMCRHRLSKTTVADASRDLISSLPIEIKHRTLECLSIEDAVRTALLSTHWNDI
nr:F-box/FBD/LRR-repeat protein At1g13570-like [Ipomoea batatas]